MEHLLVAIRQNPDIRGLQTPSCHHKCSAFADDLLLFLSAPLTSLPSLLSTIRTFSCHSNYKLNPSKSKALNVTLPSQVVHHLRSSFPFQWCTRSLKYLGVQVPSLLTDTFALNYPPLLALIKSDLSRWERRDFSWLGRINILKMNILPRLLYLFSTIPVTLPSAFFRRLSTLLSGFVWAHKRSRLSRRTLTRRRMDGGLGLPDCLFYHLAAVLARVLDCHASPLAKQWIELERYSTPMLDPKTALWLPRSTRLPRDPLDLPPSLATIIQLRRSYLPTTSLADPDGPLMPLFANPSFPPALSSRSFLGYGRDNSPALSRFLTASSLKPLRELIQDTSVTLTHTLQYSQLRHFYNSSRDTLRLHRPLSPFEKLCVSTSRAHRPVSSVYSLLLDTLRDDSLPYRGGWERELGRVFTDEEWGRATRACHRVSMSCKAQETNFKVLTRWYRVPTLLAKFYPGVSDTCWRCGEPGGTMAHVWLYCPLLAQFWTQVLDIINRLTNIQLEMDPAPLLLTILPPSLPRWPSHLAKFMLLAARSVIPRLWKSTDPPTITAWLQEVSHLGRMEELTADSRRNTEKYHLIWGPWINFLTSDSYRSLYLTP